MLYFLIALATTVVGVCPLLIARRSTEAMAIGSVGLFVTWWVYWTSTPSLAYPLFGLVGFFVLIYWILCALITEGGKTALFPLVLAGAFIGTFIWSTRMIHSTHLSNIIGPIEERVWTQDIQPKDPRHMIMVPFKTAVFLAKKAVAQGGTIGSQFNLDTKNVRLQRVHGELVYVFPLDFRSFSTWLNSTGSPAYIIVYAEDPERMPRLVELSKEKSMVYTDGAYWSHDLERHMRNNGFMNDILTDLHLELDEDEIPHWVVTTYELTVGWNGERVSGIATVNPVTGEIRRYTQSSAPEWIDRIVPRLFVQSYLTWRGVLSGGWINSWWDRLNVTKPENSILIYGEGDKAEFVTGMTSKNEHDDSLVGLMYTNSRDGKTVFYKVSGGATDDAILKAVNSNSQVQYLHLTATTPQIYNVYGSMAAVVPLMNNTHAFQGVAIVSVMNVQDVAVGKTQMEALRNYQVLVSRTGQQIALEKTVDGKTLTGVIDRIRQDVGSSGSQYVFHITGVPRIFIGSSQQYSKLALTEPGDTVTVEYVASGEETVPIRSFDNVSLPLDKTQRQNEVEQAAKARLAAEASRTTTKDITEQLKKMSPEELQRLRDLLQKK